MEWLVALGIVVVALFVLPWAVSASKRSTRGKGSGAAMGIDFALTAALDPAKAAAREVIQKKVEIGDEESGGEGELLR